MLNWLRDVPKFSLMGGIAAGAVVLLATFVILQLGNLASSNCRQVELVKKEIRTVIGGDLQTLGQRGSAGYEYYRLHPDELAKEKVQLQQQLGQFAARHC